MNIRPRFALATVFACCATTASAQDFAKIYSRYAERVAHIEVVGELYDGSIERSSGSGVLLGFGLVLTNSHVLPNEKNFKKMNVFVRFRDKDRDPHLAASFERDDNRDLALLSLVDPANQDEAGGDRCPMPAFYRNEDVVPGSRLALMGFPLNQPLSIASGLLSNQGSKKDKRWQTDTVMNYGNSGGPFFDADGVFAGVAVGGVVKYKIGEVELEVDGVNFLIPATEIRESDLFDRIMELPDAARCWTDYPNPYADDPTVFRGQELSAIKVDHAFSATKDDHPVVFASHSRTYTESISAEEGYLIRHCDWSAYSETKADQIACSVSEDGTMAVFSVRLTSGPSVDRWRGWWTGTVSLEQFRG